MERMNEDVDPRMKGMEYRDCAKGAHMTTVASRHHCPHCGRTYPYDDVALCPWCGGRLEVEAEHQCPTCQKTFACDGTCEGANAPFPFARELICNDCPQQVPKVDEQEPCLSKDHGHTMSNTRANCKHRGSRA